jgi:hypothetical protein
MFNLDETEIDLTCPNCSFSNKVKIKQIKLEETIICSGCHLNIKLQDKDGSTNRVVKSVNKSLKELNDTIDKINRRV